MPVPTAVVACCLLTLCVAVITPMEPITFPAEKVDDLYERLATARAFHAEAADDDDDWSAGTPRAALQSTLEYWRTNYSVAKLVTRINRHQHFLANGTLHFVHIPSTASDAVPLLLLHGWPGSFLEFMDVIPLLTMYHLVRAACGIQLSSH